jgi:hypothetical protein
MPRKSPPVSTGITLLNSRIIIPRAGLTEILYIQAFPIQTHSATRAIRQDNYAEPETVPLEKPSPDPPLETLSCNYATFTLYANPKLLKQITKDLPGDKLFRKVYAQLMQLHKDTL